MMQNSTAKRYIDNFIGTQVPLYNSTLESEIATQDNFMHEVEKYMTYKISMAITTYWFPILVPVGFIGNVLSLVMIQANNRNVSTCNFMAAISINDNAMMAFALNIHLITVAKVYEINDMKCKLLSSLTQVGLQNSTFQILAMTIDKFIAIKWPHKATIYSTAKRARITLVGILVWVIIYNIPHLFGSGLVGDQCLAYVIGSNITKMYSWLSIVVNAIIPFSTLIHINYIIVKTVKGSFTMFWTNDQISQRKNGITFGMVTRQKAMKSAENQLTIMLLLVTTLFLILLIPTYIRFIYLTFLERDTPSKYASSMLIYHVTHKLSNSGINFFLYCISGRKFRNDLKEILCGGKAGFPSVTREDKSTADSNVTDLTTI